MDDVLAVILGGGRGQRLFPLTQKRSKPAVPFGGKYRLIDVPVSACLNSGIRRIFVLTQYNSESLNQHISRTYNFDVFSGGFVNLIAAEQTPDNESWFKGTADAVRRSLWHFNRHRANDVLILAGDQLYRMDFRKMIDAHRASGAGATVGVLPVPEEDASGFGILKLDGEGRIVHFEEKPKAHRIPDLMSDLPGGGRGLLASMGIYVFSRKFLEEALGETSGVDFGNHVIPEAVSRGHVRGFVHRGYWEDLGTIRSYYTANLALTDPLPPFDFYMPGCPIYTHPRYLPATKVQDCTVHQALLSEGCVIVNARIERSVVGIRTRIESGAHVRESLLLGADSYETTDDLRGTRTVNLPAIGIGEGSVIMRTIVDKNARIGRNVRITNEAGVQEADGPVRGTSGPMYFIRDGIVIVPKGGVIPDGTVI